MTLRSIAMTVVILSGAVAATQAVTIPLLQSVRIDGAALAFAVVIVAGTGLLFGLAPALQTRKLDLNETVKTFMGRLR